ncbi:CAP domain-containing protein, partial [Streptomyces tricolor]
MGRLSAGVLAVAAAVSAVAFTVQPVQAADERPPLPDATDEAFNAECLAVHNQYRARHGAPPLALDDAAVAHAMDRARTASAQDG